MSFFGTLEAMVTPAREVEDEGEGIGEDVLLAVGEQVGYQPIGYSRR